MRFLVAALLLVVISPIVFAQQEVPKPADPRLVVELVAAAPDIVHPISCDFDHKGRLLVIESHTHFAPKDYTGPKFDRIQAFDVGKPGAKPTTFYQGTRHTMDLAVHPDGSAYVATRNEILRLRDNGKGVAGKPERIVFLDTKGDYPHNGLSGLCFDSKGDLTFGMGENLGAKYTLVGSDGAKFSGEGDGGHIFHCTADGKKLRRVATGFWNPFGICRDIYGRMFAVDNDPDQAPPCRMLHVVEGGDYGFRFMYGRSGKHPFQSWHGELPGTLPMMTGVGEAPCEILSYESDGLPKEYLGQLLVTSWADHRVERYQVKPHGASFKAERLPFVQGGNNFRPTGICVAPDGSLYVADWVLSNYTLHGKGAIWHIRWKDAPKVERPDDPKKALLSMHWPLREATAKKMARLPKDRGPLREYLRHPDSRMRAAALTALLNANDSKLDLHALAADDQETGLRELAMCAIGLRYENARPFLDSKYSLRLHMLALAGLRLGEQKDVAPVLFGLFKSPDPFLRNEAIRQFGRRFDLLDLYEETELQPGCSVGFLLAGRSQTRIRFSPAQMRLFLNDKDEDVRFLVVKWVADEKLADFRKDVEKLMTDPKLNVRMYLACATALARLDGKEVSETKLADYFAKRLADDKTPPAQRAMLLKQVPANHPLLKVDLLARLVDADDVNLKREAVRALVDHPSTLRHVPLRDVVDSPSYSAHLRGYAMLGLLDMPAKELAPKLLAIAGNPKLPHRVDAERALLGIEIEPGRPFTRPAEKGRPPTKDIDAWMKRLEGKADAESGERIFFHPRLTGCAKCHRIDGRGADVGPDLSGIGRSERRNILESILQPSNTIAPHYVPWVIEMKSGKIATGMLVHTNLDEYTFLDANGGRFKLKTGDIVEQRTATVSIMPEGLVDRLTDQEVRDLLAYLQARK